MTMTRRYRLIIIIIFFFLQSKIHIMKVTGFQEDSIHVNSNLIAYIRKQMRGFALHRKQKDNFNSLDSSDMKLSILMQFKKFH